MLRTALFFLVTLAALALAILQFGRGFDESGFVLSAVALIAALLGALDFRDSRRRKRL